MKKTKIIGAILAGVLMFTGVPAVSNPFTTVAYAATSKLAAPTGFKAASTTETSIKLTWNKVSGADAYRVYMYNSKTDKFETYKNVSSNVCNVKSLKKGTKYKFKVAALVKSGSKYAEQPKSSSISVKTDEKKLPAPQNIKAEKTDSSIKLSWDKVNGASAYRVFIYNNNSGEYETYKNVSGTNCNVDGLESSTKYKFKIAALVKSESKYKVQTQTGIVSVTTDKETLVMRTTPGSFTFCKANEKLSSVLKNSGIANYTKSKSDDGKTTYYTGEISICGERGEAVFGFNESNELVIYNIQTSMSYTKFDSLFHACKKQFGKPSDYKYKNYSEYHYWMNWDSNYSLTSVQLVQNIQSYHVMLTVVFS